ncbi:MAG TPA: metallophosphoesterase [Acidobacteriota bacterium]|nr:metallophosphoesterase [Acidobacteriota bacterium]
MKLQILSDLHLEINPCEVPAVGDVIVLAGDIHVGTEGIAWAKSHLSGRPVVYVAGNHEFYRRLFPDLLDELRAEADGSNVVFLENDAFVIGGVRFLGATLWTDFTLNGCARQEINMAAAKHGLNDFRAIKKASGELLHPSDVAEVHCRSVEWLRARLAERHEGPTVVVTHHVPCIMSTHPQNRFDPLTAAFVNNLENLILDHQPAIWISGHTHYCSDYRIGETRLISNQRGYSDIDDTGGFAPGRVIEIPLREVSRV